MSNERTSRPGPVGTGLGESPGLWTGEHPLEHTLADDGKDFTPPPDESGGKSPEPGLKTVVIILSVLIGLIVGTVLGSLLGATFLTDDDDNESTGESISLDGPAEAAGDEHIITVSEGLDLRDDLPDEVAFELGHKVCEYLDNTDGDFDGLDQILASPSTSAATRIEVGTVALAGVPAYCPEWTDGLIAWGEGS